MADKGNLWQRKASRMIYEKKNDGSWAQICNGCNNSVSNKLLDLNFADDICVVTHRWSEMHKVINDLHVFGQESGSAINKNRGNPHK